VVGIDLMGRRVEGDGRGRERKRAGGVVGAAMGVKEGEIQVVSSSPSSYSSPDGFHYTTLAGREAARTPKVSSLTPSVTDIQGHSNRLHQAPSEPLLRPR
jgi:hypothetical protein